MKDTPIPAAHATRESWLLAAVALMTPLFKGKDYEVPVNLQVACGWPSKSGLAAKKRRVGECWASEASSDKKFQIFISPWLNNVTVENDVLATLVHEVVHAVVGLDAKHGKVFKKCALAVGLDGKMTATFAGPELLEYIKGWAEKLGAYPNGKLDSMKSLTKKDTCRQLKCECPQCGYTVRLSRKWMEEVGLPHCPKHGEMKSEKPLPPKDDDGGEGDE
jgi:hypothetical protein